MFFPQATVQGRFKEIQCTSELLALVWPLVQDVCGARVLQRFGHETRSPARSISAAAALRLQAPPRSYVQPRMSYRLFSVSGPFPFCGGLSLGQLLQQLEFWGTLH